MLGLEGCLSGNVPAGPPPARRRRRPVRATGADEAGEGRLRPGDVPQRGRQPDLRPVRAPRAASRRARPSRRRARRLQARARPRLERRRGAGVRREGARTSSPRSSTATSSRSPIRYGITSPPSLNDPQFVSRLVFDDRRGAGVPKARFASIFPGKEGALIQVRLRDGLSAAQRARAISDIRAAAAMPDWRLSAGRLRGDRRAGRRAGALEVDLALDDHPAARRGARDGADAAARLPGAAAARCRCSSRSAPRR